MIRAVPGKAADNPKPDDNDWTVEEAFGGYLLDRRDPVLLKYLEKEAGTLRRILLRLKQADTNRAVLRTEQIGKALLLVQEALSYYESDKKG